MVLSKTFFIECFLKRKEKASRPASAKRPAKPINALRALIAISRFSTMKTLHVMTEITARYDGGMTSFTTRYDGNFLFEI